MKFKGGQSGVRGGRVGKNDLCRKKGTRGRTAKGVTVPRLGGFVSKQYANAKGEQRGAGAAQRRADTLERGGGGRSF